ncbi:VOC family protein [Solwaraspora sp. WMMD1047]|uniref:VOC family protein n=1 Tax=Solwaraspora sp. WMMD1047 TaxID=3016102 RepID=UPI002417E373|nr:VOC family protein [Solwaraspora sp. WMMD1047]MDG4829806.1 VOC family protein [Solwaraspora sp. WMMD1047]
MTARIRHIDVDCAEPYQLAGFWSAVLDYPVHPDDQPDDDEVLIVATEGAGPSMLFLRVPEGKSTKNRLHLDVQPTDRTRDEEVERLVGLGAARIADHRRPDGTGWVVLADPAGNEFCVERSDAERGPS